MPPGTDRRPTLVIVSGRPGSGKTTLARILAHALPCPLVSRDEINEGIHHTFGHESDLASKDRVAALAFEAFFRILELLLSSAVTLVAEAAFQDHRWRAGLVPLVPLADLRLIHCTVDPELAYQRYLQRRLARPSARAGEPAAMRPFEPLSLPVPSIHVRTTDGYDPELDGIIAFVTAGSPPNSADVTRRGKPV